MRRIVGTGFTVTLASLALLVPAGSAQATWHEAQWCMSSTTPGVGVVVPPYPGSCTSFPLNVNEFRTGWFLRANGSGRVCLGLTYYGGPDHGKPIDGVPGLNCVPLTFGGDSGSTGQEGFNRWQIYQFNPWARYSYRYGQARIINFSSAPIELVANLNSITYWTP